MPQMQKVNMRLYQQCGKQIHLFSQTHLLTALSPLSLIITVKVTEATVPSWSKRLAATSWDQGGVGTALALSPYWLPQ